MNKRRAFLDRIYARKRVDITSKKYLQTVKRLLITTTTLTILLVIGLLFMFGINLISVTISFLIAVPIFLLSSFLHKHISATAVKADTLIVTSLTKRSAVTSIRSIRQIKGYSILGFQITRIKYFLDGRNRLSLIINFCNSYPFTPSHSIGKALELSKKQKANHKPGSVAV